MESYETTRLPFEELFDSGKTKLSKESFDGARETFAYVSKECSATVRHALAINADYIVVLDKAARNYGYIFLKTIPAICEEIARIKGVPIKDIKVPEVKFLNPSTEVSWGLSHEYKFSPKEEDEEMMKKMFNDKTVLVFDESSDSNFRNYNNVHELKPSEQYDFWDNDTSNEQFAGELKSPIGERLLDDRSYFHKKRKQWFGEEEIPPPRGRGFMAKPDYRPKSVAFSEWLHKKYGTNADVHIGISSGGGGVLHGLFDIYTKHKEGESVAHRHNPKIEDSNDSDLFSIQNPEFKRDEFDEYVKPALDAIIKDIQNSSKSGYQNSL